MIDGFETLTLEQLAAFEFPDVSMIVDGLLPAGALVLVAGRPKAGKSLLFGIDLCASVALGETFIDRATIQGPALYVPAEDALRLVRDRLWTRIGDERAAPLHVLPVDGSLPQSLRIDDADSMARLLATIKAIEPRVVVLDPLRELHHQKENASDDMAAVMRPLRQIAHETETTIVLPHHRNKQSIDVAQASRGSNAIPAGADVVITLDVANDGDREGGELAVDQTLLLHVEGRYGPRQRLAARLGEGLRWQPVNPSTVIDLNAAERVVRALEIAGGALTADEIAKQAGIAHKTVQNVLTTLTNAQRVSREGAGTKGEPFRYAPRHQARKTVGTNVGTNIPASTSQEQAIRPDPTCLTRVSGGIIFSNGHTDEPLPQNACADCGNPCGGARLCSACAAAAVNRRKTRTPATPERSEQ